MEWLEVFVETSEDGIEIVSGLLYSLGVSGLMIEDEREFKEFLENPNREWDYIDDGLDEEKSKRHTGITFFVTDNLSGLETLSNVKSAVKALKEREKEFDLGSLEITMKNIREEDWANNWKKYFKPFPVGGKIMIKPSWEELESGTDRVVLNIDPGHIFGTGTHETTQCCLEHIENYIKEGDKVLDIGCGSGILFIASLLLGAGGADAVDIDPNAVKIVTENAERNGIDPSLYNVYAGNILEDENLAEKFGGNKYDIVEANIVADIIIAVCPMARNFIKKGGVFISSGIIDTRCAEVENALRENGFTVLDIKKRKDWRAIAARFEG